jgi:O-methyltransferase involved in polyketide biosynthesis
MPPEKYDKDISSAEMTAHWRSMEAQFSADPYSTHMATDAGRAKANEYLSKQYPFAVRHFSLRAKYFRQNALMLLFKPGADYDSILSLGSGFSLLTYTIALAFRAGDSQRKIYVLDSDIPKILQARQEKLKKLGLASIDGVHFEQQVLNIEQSFKDGKSVQACFSPHVKKPIIILEGLSYFLTPACLQWLFDGIKKGYPGAAIIWDYWPESLITRSPFFTTVLEYFKKELPEDVRALISTELLDCLSCGYDWNECDLAEFEKQVIPDKKNCLLTDEKTHIPARMGRLCVKN